MSVHGKHELAQILGDVSEIEACEARERMVGSATFRSAPQLASFLNYIVKTTMLGRQHEIKGYTIAVEALGRPDDFDPVADPIVRVEAGRLRRAIDAYYAGEGAGDPVRIHVERGSYVPRFEKVAATAEPTATPGIVTPDQVARTKPEAARLVAQPEALLPGRMKTPAITAPTTIASDGPSPGARALPSPSRANVRWLAALAAVMVMVLGLAAYLFRRDLPGEPQIQVASETAQTSAMQRQPTIQVVFLPGSDAALNVSGRYYDELVSDALSRFDDFSVLKATPNANTARASQPTYRYEVGAQPENAGQVTLSVRLLHVASGRLVWSGGREYAATAIQRLDQIKEIARTDAVRLAQPYGLLHADLRANSVRDGPVHCVVKTYDYWSSPSAAVHAEVRDCLEATLKADPNYHPAWSLLAMIHLDEYRIGYNPRPGSALDRATRAAQRAVSLSPESARALQGLMAVLTVSGETEEALKVGFEAVRRNPFDTDILADVGARLTQTGRAREGRPLLLRAAEVNRVRPVWHEFYLYLSARAVGDIDGVRSSLRTLELAEAPLAFLAQAIGASDKGARVDSMVAMRKLALISPVFGDDAGEFLDRAFFARDVRSNLLEALVRGGLSDLSKG